jgi:hypothetical protein
MIADKVKNLVKNSVEQFSIIENDVDEYIVRFYNGKVSIAAKNKVLYLQILATKGKKKVFKVITDMSSLENGVEDALKTLELTEEGEVPEIYPKTSYSSKKFQIKR